MAIWQDVRLAIRLLLKDRWFTAIAALALSLGIGVNTTVFTFANAIILRGLPFADPDSIVSLGMTDARGRQLGVSRLDFLDWRDGSKTIAMGIASGEWLTMTGNGEPLRVNARMVSPDLLEILGSKTATGRTFLPEEGVPGGDNVMLVSHRFLEQRLGSDPNILGRSLILNGTPYKVIGTLPPDSWFEWYAILNAEYPNYCIGN